MRIHRKTICQAEQEVGFGISVNLLSDSAVNPSHQSALRKSVQERTFRGEGGGRD